MHQWQLKQNYYKRTSFDNEISSDLSLAYNTWLLYKWAKLKNIRLFKIKSQK